MLMLMRMRMLILILLNANAHVNANANVNSNAICVKLGRRVRHQLVVGSQAPPIFPEPPYQPLAGLIGKCNMSWRLGAKRKDNRRNT